MVSKILTDLDRNSSGEKYAVLAQFVDWSKAFDRQDSTLGIQAFKRNGVRPSLIPLLISFFKDRSMTVKWHGTVSKPRNLPGGGPQGSTMGLLEYGVQSNDNADHVPEDERYKFVDDMSLLELLNLLLIGLSYYDFKNHVASDIGIDQYYVPPENIKSQQSLSQIEAWTSEKLMKLNVSKTKYMIFNFTSDFQFATRLSLENQLIDCVQETTLLGTIITSDLKWSKNTDMLVRKASKRMVILQKLKSFNVANEDMLNIYKLYIRSVVEQNCSVWHHSLSQEDQANIERVQKVACKIILQSLYSDYEEALSLLGLETLFQRREKLCLTFAKKCVNHPKASSMFPLNKTPNYALRKHEKYVVQSARTSRLHFSAIPQMQRALNHDNLNNPHCKA